MIIIGIVPQELTQADLSLIKNKILNYFVEGEGKLCQVKSLYLQLMKKKRTQNDEVLYEHLFGETYITEKILGKTFRISPQAFFQINTNVAEILYDSIAELSELSKDVTLLDVCCGTGSIGICLSDVSK